jgi:heterodisulfide reductase subunit B
MVDVTDRAKKYASVAYYPGCALEGTGNGYDVSTRAIAKKLDLKLKDVSNWNCCWY